MVETRDEHGKHDPEPLPDKGDLLDKFIDRAGPWMRIVAGVLVLAVLTWLLRLVIGLVYPAIATAIARHHRFALFCALILIGCGLFVVRLYWRLVYSLFELGAALVTLWDAIDPVFPTAPPETPPHMVGIGLKILGAVYLIVRGLDNCHVWWTARKKRREDRARAAKLAALAQVTGMLTRASDAP